MQRSDLSNKLEKIGVSDREKFKGHLVSAQTPDGQPVLLIVGPKNMQGDKSVDGFNQDHVRGDLRQAGFRDIRFVGNAQMERGQLDDDQQVLALSGERAGWQPTTGSAQSGQPDADRLKGQLDKAGLEDVDDFKGELLRARTGSGATALLVIAPEDFKGDKSVKLSAEDLNKLQQNGFENVDVAQNVRMMEGEMGDAKVIVIAGDSVTGTTGRTASRSN